MTTLIVQSLIIVNSILVWTLLYFYMMYLDCKFELHLKEFHNKSREEQYKFIDEELVKHTSDHFTMSFIEAILLSHLYPENETLKGLNKDNKVKFVGKSLFINHLFPFKNHDVTTMILPESELCIVSVNGQVVNTWITSMRLLKYYLILFQEKSPLNQKARNKFYNLLYNKPVYQTIFKNYFAPNEN